MDSKRKSMPKSLGKSSSKLNLKEKRTASPASKQSKKDKSQNNAKNIISQLVKKPTQQLTKKKIEDLKPPELLIKVNYKNKKISIPIHTCDDKSLKDTVIPHIIRFQHEVLRNAEFDPSHIVNWKTTGRGDVLKDYYFQTSKPIKIFKDQFLEIQPIWKEKKQNKISLKDFQIVRCIGTGGFSRVFLARLRKTGVFYALKLMEKEGLFQSGKECVISNQRNIMVGLNNPYIVNLEFAFETKHFVALALQYCPGGQLFYYLRKTKKMTEDQARFCFVQILLGIQYLHSQNIIYRDIKPQNIMIDMNGNLKIADFGLSKEGLRQNELTTTYCGSPEYMAPEMLSKSGHSYAVDYYCLGALLYQLVTGNPPFYSRDVEKIYHSIKNEQIEFPSHIELSQQIKMLIVGLLIKDPRKRLGSMGGIRQILGHPWVRKIKPLDITNKNITTPLKINLLTFNINEQEIEEGGELFQHKFQDEDGDYQHEFEQFYFNRSKSIKILDESESTKQHKTSYKYDPKIPINTNKKKTIDYKSSLSRQKNGQFAINMEDMRKQLASEVNRTKQTRNLKIVKSKKQINLIERAKRHDDKSVSRIVKQKSKYPLNIKKTMGSVGLKRIKSSTTLNSMLRKHN